MAASKQVHPMPFPGESPTISLALAAGRTFGLQPEEKKPSRSAPKRKASAKKSTKAGKSAKATRASSTKSKKPAPKSRAR
jgi:hypothetical protein